MKHVLRSALALAIVLLLGPAKGQTQQTDRALAAKLSTLDMTVIAPESDRAKGLRRMLGYDISVRLRAANERDRAAWAQVQTRADWEQFRDQRLQALKTSLGQFPPPPKDLKVRVARTLTGDGYRIENLVFESRPGLVVTANLYLPAKANGKMPGILICHSHHNPKSQGELQDMGMTWARLGCAVLVMDQLGHGERRQHPFKDAGSYPHPFKVGRQDYYFRYNVGNQLQLLGDSLIGWMYWDLMRGVDLLLSRPGIDAQQIILLGAVAGGGDPAAVTAALDPRIAGVVPFNFGGPQPETAYPLPADAEARFNYAGSGSWESTRNLRLSARDGFLPWVIVGAVAPRGLIYAHEFAWDRDHDPVWQRLAKIYSLYGQRERLAASAGRGKVTGKPPESTHCNNIGPEHRRGIYPSLAQWFAIPEPVKEFQQRRPAEELRCLTVDAGRDQQPRPLHAIAQELGAARLAAARGRLAALPAKERVQRLRDDWERLLGGVAPGKPRGTPVLPSGKVGNVMVERYVLEPEPGIVVPVAVLVPPHAPGARLPVVVPVAQAGKEAFLRQRSEAIAALLQGGVAVCLPDVRGTGETRPAGDSRGRASTSTSLSATEWMLGQTLLGGRLRDLRTVLHWLRERPYVAVGQLALWGDSFAPVNHADANFAVPWDAERLPAQAEPLGGLLALLGALYDEDVCAVYVRGGLTGYLTLLDSPFCWVPHDALVPGALTVGDLADVAAVLAPRPVLLEGLVDGRNRRATTAALGAALAPAQAAYESAGAADRLRLAVESQAGAAARWLLRH
jgi:dienelactone hydrolase